MTLTGQFEKSGGMRKGGDQEGAGEPAAETPPLGSPIRMDGREAGLELEGYFGLRKFVFHLLFKTGDKNACFNADEDAPIQRKTLIL